MAQSRYAVRHLIGNEMEAERLRRGETGEALSRTAGDIISAYQIKPAQGLKPTTKEATDFFGRAIVAKAAIAAAAPAGGATLAVPVAHKKAGHAVYKFHEGFSNAVRVTKRVGDFLGL